MHGIVRGNMKHRGGRVSEREWGEVTGENERKQCVDGTEKRTYREDVAAHLQNASAGSVGVTALTPAESEYCQSAVGPLESSDDE